MQPKWKYKVVAMKTPTFAKAADKLRMHQETLERLGMEGWELVQVLVVHGDMQPKFYLKRPY